MIRPAMSKTNNPREKAAAAAAGKAGSAASGKKAAATDKRSTTPASKSATGKHRTLTDLHPVETLKEKAHEPTQVRGHDMQTADIFKLVGLIAFFVLMGVIVWLIWPYIGMLFEPDCLQKALDEVRDDGFVGVLMLLGLQFLQIVVAFIPGEAVQIAAGALYGPWLGALIILLGCIFSSAFVFILVSKLGAPFVQAMVPEKYIDKLNAFEESPKFDTIIFILFLIPGMPKDVFTYIVPLTKMPLAKFLLITNVGRIPGVILSTYAASGLVNGQIWESVVIFAIAAVVAILAIIFSEKIMNTLGSKMGK